MNIRKPYQFSGPSGKAPEGAGAACAYLQKLARLGYGKILFTATMIFVMAVSVVNSLKVELYKEYFLSGRVFRVVRIRGGTMHGPARTYYENGMVASEIFYRHNRRHGPFKRYYHSGRLQVEGVCADNYINGVYKEYYESGRLRLECVYSNEESSSQCTAYYEDGRLWEKLVREDETLLDANRQAFSGEKRNYYPDGTLASEAVYVDGKLEGEAREYAPDGVPQRTAFYFQGRRQGVETTYFKDGKREMEILYNRNMIDFIKIYNEQGSLIFEKRYGLLSG